MEQVPYSASEGSGQTADAQADQSLESTHIKIAALAKISTQILYIVSTPL